MNIVELITINMPLIIKEINIKINILDNSGDTDLDKEKKMSDNQIDEIIEKCTKIILKQIKRKQQR